MNAKRIGRTQIKQFFNYALFVIVSVLFCCDPNLHVTQVFTCKGKDIFHLKARKLGSKQFWLKSIMYCSKFSKLMRLVDNIHFFKLVQFTLNSGFSSGCISCLAPSNRKSLLWIDCLKGNTNGKFDSSSFDKSFWNTQNTLFSRLLHRLFHLTPICLLGQRVKFLFVSVLAEWKTMGMSHFSIFPINRAIDSNVLW